MKRGMYLRRDSLGRAEIVGHGEFIGEEEIGLFDILSKAEKVGMISAPQPTRYSVTVYQQRRRRIGGAAYWDRDTDFTGSTPEEATQKAQKYIQGKGWQLSSG